MSRWQVHAAAFVGVQLCAAALLSLFVDFRGEPPFISYGSVVLVLIAPVAMFYFARASWRLRHADRIIQSIEYDWPRIRYFAIGAGLAWLQLVSLTWHKALIPFFTPMWADPMLADLDKLLFGVDPWLLIQWLEPASGLIDFGYSLWAGAFKITFLFVLLNRTKEAAPVALAFFLIIGLMGAWGQYLLPSGGPIFWERLGYGDRFDELIPAANALDASNYLWLKYQGHELDFASGISAFPSIHVATAAWMVICAFTLFPRWKIPALAFYTLVLFGSVFLGWHYAVDGVAGSAGAVLCYALAKRMLGKSSESLTTEASFAR